MNPVHELLIILAGLFLLDAVRAVPLGGLVLSSAFGRRAAALRPVVPFGRGQAGLTLTFPTPVGWSFNAAPPPIAFAPAGILSATPFSHGPLGRPPSRPRSLTWDRIVSVSVDHETLRINGEPFADAGRPAVARHLAVLIDTLRNTPPSDRPAAVERTLDAMFDDDAFSRARRRYRADLLRLRLLATLAFSEVFVALPLLDRYVAAERWWPVLLIAYTLTVAGIVWTAARLHRAAHPDARAERRKRMILLALAAPTTLRAGHDATPDLFVAWHPLLVARPVLGRARFRELAGEFLRDARHPRPGFLGDGAREPARAVETWYRQALGDRLARWLVGHGIDAEELMRPDTPNAAAYCPRCLATFRRADAVCHACDGLAAVTQGRHATAVPLASTPSQR